VLKALKFLKNHIYNISRRQKNTCCFSHQIIWKTGL